LLFRAGGRRKHGSWVNLGFGGVVPKKRIEVHKAWRQKGRYTPLKVKKEEKKKKKSEETPMELG